MLKNETGIFVCCALAAVITIWVAPVQAQDLDWLPDDAANNEFVYHGGRVSIGVPWSNQKKLLVHVGAAQNDGVWVAGDGGFSLGLLANVYPGAFGPNTQSGDLMLIAKGPAINYDLGLMITTWGAEGGIRLDGNGHVGIGLPFPAADMLAVGGNMRVEGNQVVSGEIQSTTGFTFPDGSTQLKAAVNSLSGPGGTPEDVIWVNAAGNVGIGTQAIPPTDMLHVAGRVSVQEIEIRGADLAERFDISDQLDVLPGDVVSIDPSTPGALRISNEPYDRKVVGVVSGANGIRTGVTLGQAGTLADGAHAVALTGRVYVRADASAAAIVPGDLLTTSAIPGHVMKVTDIQRANGAILGKAMTALEDDQGMVLMVVALQ